MLVKCIKNAKNVIKMLKKLNISFVLKMIKLN